MGKTGIKHSHTLIKVIGNGSSVSNDILIQTRSGERSVDGSNQSYQTQGNLTTDVMAGDVVKYLNVILQTAVTSDGNDGNTQTQGWVEWALVFANEKETPIPSTNIGLQTLGDICSKMFRGDCLMSGQFPVSVNLPNVETIQLKLPRKASTFKIGSIITLYTMFRDSDITNLQTDTIKLVVSEHYKSYN